MSATALMSTANQLAQTTLQTVQQKWRELLEKSPQTWFSMVWDWVRNTKTGRLFGGLIAFLITRPMVDSLVRYVKNYPPGTIGIIPMMSTLKTFSPNNTEFVLSQKPKYGSISMHMVGFTPFVLINSKEECDWLLNKKPHNIVTRGRPMTKAQREKDEELFAPVMGHLAFTIVDSEMNWAGRRKFFTDTKKTLVQNMDTLRSMIAQYFENRLCPRIESGEIWKEQRQEILRVQFNTMLHFQFGAEVEPSEEEVNAFVEDVESVSRVQQLLFMCREFPIPWLGLRLYQMLTGDQSTVVKQLKDRTMKFMREYKENSVQRSQAHYAHVLLEKIESGEISELHAGADLAVLFLGGTHGSSTVTEQALMHCARDLRMQQQLHSELRREFSEPENLNVHDLKVKVPGIVALVWETLRLNEAVRFNVPRCLHESVQTSQGYTLPPGSVLFLNIYQIHRDPSIWGEDSWDFKPSRWFSEDGSLNTKLKSESVAFGAGERNCPGFDLAENQIILIVSHFLWRFKVESPESGDPKETLPLLTEYDFNEVESQLPLKFSLLEH